MRVKITELHGESSEQLAMNYNYHQGYLHALKEISLNIQELAGGDEWS